MARRRTHTPKKGPRSAPVVTINISTPAALLGIGALVVTSVGVADAATGGNFILGHSNKANKLTSLENTNGTALSLKAKAGSAPLKVSNNKLVKNLNANFLNGLGAAKFQRRVTGTCLATGIKAIGAGGAAGCALPGQIVFTASQNFTVPAGVTHLTGELWGAGGGGGAGYGGGAQGGFESVMITVSAGDVVNVVVGEGGTGINFGAGLGGGNTSISLNSGSSIASAGGGQGGAYGCGPVTGGGPGAISAPAVGLDSGTGAGGDCSVSGGTGFAGAGGSGGSGSGYTGHTGSDGLVILNIDN